MARHIPTAVSAGALASWLALTYGSVPRICPEKGSMRADLMEGGSGLIETVTRPAQISGPASGRPYDVLESRDRLVDLVCNTPRVHLTGSDHVRHADDLRSHVKRKVGRAVVVGALELWGLMRSSRCKRTRLRSSPAVTASASSGLEDR
jgi:hypothetical protein